VITTDCMEMHAISKTIGTVEGTYQAFKAGIDLAFISHSHDLQEGAIERLVQGIEAGEVTEERLDESVARILALKEKYDSWDAWLPLFAKADLVPDALVGGKEHQELARRVMEEAITLTKNDAGLLPLQIDPDERIGVVCLKNVLLSPVEDERYLINPVQQAVEALHRNVCAVEVSNNPSNEDIDSVLAAMDGCAAVIIGTLNAQLQPQQVELVKRLNGLSAPLIVISMRTPYDLGAFAEVKAHIAAYEFTPVAAEIAVEAIFGRRKLQGHLPVTLPGLFAQGHYVVGKKG
ncbi:MAG: glycoside hydrolase family 3 C-terminal domain-containing protein, partial [Tumebacillaceae bacterium]